MKPNNTHTFKFHLYLKRLCLKKSTCLQCDGCKLEFGLQEHLLDHVLSDHLLPNSRMLQCPWFGCSQWLSTVDGSQVCVLYLVYTSIHIQTP